MRHIIVEFGAYGDVADFEVEDTATEDEICVTAWEYVTEFASMEWSFREEEK